MNCDIWNGDCLDLMPNIAAASVDLVLCDLPYGTTAPRWDARLDMTRLWAEYRRILKPRGTIALFACQPFTTKLIASNEAQFKYCWYWIKNQGTNFFHARRMPIRRVEEICIFGNGTYRPQVTTGHVPTNSATGVSAGKVYFGTNRRRAPGGKTTRYPTNVLEFPCVSNYRRKHNNEKPVALLEYIVKTYTDEGQLVLDNCAGSGSTGEACLKTGRAFILIEKEKEYFEIAVSRCKNKRTIKEEEAFPK